MVIKYELDHKDSVEFLQVLEVIHGMKQTALKVLLNFDGHPIEGLYRPEKTLRLTLDIRVPVPEELIRDICYTQVSEFLGWGVGSPAISWELKQGDLGVLRPFYSEVENLQHYHLTQEFLEKSNLSFWIKVAILDYITGVVDRNYNDILLVLPEHDIWRSPSLKKNEEQNSLMLNSGLSYHAIVVDSGLSFVNGTEFVTQSSVIRSALQNFPIPDEILADLRRIVPESMLLARLERSIDSQALLFFKERVSKILSSRIIL